MATSRQQHNIDDDEGYGSGGKIRKRPNRRNQTTPYDRPLEAKRIGNRNNKGLLSKLVDLTHRVTNKIFGSGSHRQLLPPPQLDEGFPVAEEVRPRHEDQQEKSECPAATSKVVQVGDANVYDNPNNGTNRAEFAELEQILMQKTFNRYEIDQLTSILHSRTVHVPIENENKRCEVIPLKQLVSHERKEEFSDTPIRDNRIHKQLMSSPLIRSRVLDENISSPAELAKAYMGSKSSKVDLLNRSPFPLKSPIADRLGVPGNGIATSKSKGRSALYSMARTPYSRPNSSAKGAGSSTLSPWEQNTAYGSSRGTLKRRGSTLDSDIGSIGPIRRVRQKSNLLSPRNLSLPASRSQVSFHVKDSQYPLSSNQRSLIGEHGFARNSSKDAASSVPNKRYTPGPSKSSEVASKIFQQLDLVTPREKSPVKLSSFMLEGAALQNVDIKNAPKRPENIQDNMKLSISDQQEKIEESATVINVVSNNSFNAAKDADAKINYPAPDGVEYCRQNKGAFRMSAYSDDDDFSDRAASTFMAEEKDNLEKETTVSEVVGVEKVAGSVVELPITFVSNRKPEDGTLDASLNTEDTGITSSNASQTQSVLDFVKTASLQNNSNAAPVTDKVSSPKEPNGVSANINFNFGPQNSSSFPIEAANRLPQIPESGQTIVNNTLEAGLVSSASASLTGNMFLFGTAANSSCAKSGSLGTFPSSSPFGTLPVSSVGAASESSSHCLTMSNNSSPGNTLPTSTFANSESTSSHAAPSSVHSFPSVPPINSSLEPVFPSVPSISSTSPVFKFSPGVTSASVLSTSASASTELTEAKTWGPRTGSGSLATLSSQVPSSGSSLFVSTPSTTPSAGTHPFVSTVSDPGSTGSTIFGSSSATGTGMGTGSVTGSSTFAGVSSVTAPGSDFSGFASTITNTGSNTSSLAFSSQVSSPFGLGNGANPNKNLSTDSNPFTASTSSKNTFVFGSSTGSSSSSSFAFSFKSAPAATTLPTPGNPNPIFGFSSPSVQNNSSNDQMNMEDSMCEDTVEGSTLKGPVFSQTPQSGFAFGGAAPSPSPSGANPFAFGTQQNSTTTLSGATPPSGANPFAFGTQQNPTTTPSGATPSGANPFAFGTQQIPTTTPSGATPPSGANPFAFGTQQNPTTTPSVATTFQFGTQQNPTAPLPPSGASLFQFATPQNPTAPQNSSLFPASNSLGSNAGGSFSVGSGGGGGEKPRRKILKVKRHK